MATERAKKTKSVLSGLKSMKEQKVPKGTVKDKQSEKKEVSIAKKTNSMEHGFDRSATTATALEASEVNVSQGEEEETKEQ